ncbi:hypothetical protein [Actinomadura terrae]|uniref:hypothetical protein n=1 Tax=Actinomadura terrae TaxID=604353 RepID=UPI001FA802BD|nr:hypothetical protein [Actinomadura terrae]
MTVVERFPALRASGAQADLRGQGIEAVARMGLLDAVRSRLVDEAGVALRRLPGEAEGDDHGQHLRQDLLIGANGQGSRLRRALLPEGADPYWRVGIHMAYWFVPRIAADGDIRDTYMVPGGRQILRRSHNPTETRVYFVMRGVGRSIRDPPRSRRAAALRQRGPDRGEPPPATRRRAHEQACDHRIPVRHDAGLPHVSRRRTAAETAGSRRTASRPPRRSGIFHRLSR